MEQTTACQRVQTGRTHPGNTDSQDEQKEEEDYVNDEVEQAAEFPE